MKRWLLACLPLALVHCSDDQQEPVVCLAVASDGEDRCLELASRPIATDLSGSVITADVDGDGLEDIVASSGHILWGDGEETAFGADGPLTALALGDTDGDDAVEVLWSEGGSALHRAVLGEDRQWDVEALDVGVPVVDVAVGDLDGDGLDDVVVAAQQRVRVLWSDGDGIGARWRDWTELDVPESAHAHQLPSPGAFALRVDVGDFDGDGRLDILFVGRWQAWHLLGNEDESFDAPGDAGLADAQRPWVIGDFDDDGQQELFGVFPTIPGRDDRPEIRAVAWLEDPSWTHALIVLDTPGGNLAAGRLWSDDSVALAMGYAAQTNRRAMVTLDGWDRGSLRSRVELELELEPVVLAVANGELLVADGQGTGRWIDLGNAVSGTTR